MNQYEELNFTELDAPLLRFIATGNTYPHREKLRSWSWHWDKTRQAWVNENETSDDSICIKIAKDLPGVVVKCEP